MKPFHTSRLWMCVFLFSMTTSIAKAQNPPAKAETRANAPGVLVDAPLASDPSSKPTAPSPWPSAETFKSLQTFGLFAAISIGPVAILMLTAFTRINIVLLLLRQALGSPQIPGNQVLSALALLLTLVVMRPAAEATYTRGVSPYLQGKLTPIQAWEAGSLPIKRFMVDQIVRTNHQHYLTELNEYSQPGAAARTAPVYGDEYPFPTLATAFLLSELTTALMIGFLIYLPFLVVDLVVAAVLAAMGLVMLPPTLVAMPLKLILFVMADGWLLVATRLLATFSVGQSG